MPTAADDKWIKLQRHRREAAKHPLAILVWGPSDDGTPEYRTRCEIRDRLLAAGHDARFSEELARHPAALRDPIDDETLQADSADLIVVLYGSRGTQTEHDVILSNPDIATKAIIAIEKAQEDVLVQKALASEAWKQTKRHARIITYERASLPGTLVGTVCEIAQEVRQACYVRMLRFGGFLR